MLSIASHMLCVRLSGAWLAAAVGSQRLLPSQRSVAGLSACTRLQRAVVSEAAVRAPTARDASAASAAAGSGQAAAAAGAMAASQHELLRHVAALVPDLARELGMSCAWLYEASSHAL